MPKARGYPFKAFRSDRDHVKLDFTHNLERIRGEVTLDALAALVRGEVDKDVNLAPGAQPTLFGDFANGTYGPYSATPRLDNAVSLLAETNLVKAVCVEIGKTYLHAITTPDLERLKAIWLKKEVANSTIKRRLNALRRVMDYAVATGMIKRNPLPPVKGLKALSRADIWLKTEEFDRLLEHCDPTIRQLTEYLGLTGARIHEALSFRAGDLRDGRLFVPTEKRGLPCRELMREFNTASLGPRFARLQKLLNPHPKTGFYFCTGKGLATGRPLSYNHFQRLFARARVSANLPHIRPHDLRGTFSIHRAIVVKSFRQLMIELGHGDPRSIESYLARAQRFDPTESYFYNPAEESASVAPAAANGQTPATPAGPQVARASSLVH